MKISTKGRYGVRAMIDLALQDSRSPVLIKDICQRQDISQAYLEQILCQLKTAGLVRSTAGPKGGFTLARRPAEIKAIEIFQVTEGSNFLADCLNDPSSCPRSEICISRRLWVALKKAVDKVLSTTSLQDLLDGDLE
jgi:Rrf2 family transcriptional regulator, cysteine metabolism repressor